MSRNESKRATKLISDSLVHTTKVSQLHEAHLNNSAAPVTVLIFASQSTSSGSITFSARRRHSSYERRGPAGVGTETAGGSHLNQPPHRTPAVGPPAEFAADIQ